ncbi:MAG TPA: hypothetical protein VMH91_00665 [Candidatus Paceibacterota bacterium]|nr:hypothetical protein [Candidatus Paceibacterota bacterium]
MRTSLTYGSFAALALSLSMWGAAWFFFSDTSARLAARAEALSSSSIQNAQQVNAIELHAIVVDTASDRATLDGFVGTDVVGIANAIQSAGQAAGTKTTIGSATAATHQNPTSGVSQLEFVVQSTGTFAQVWRAAQLFGSLPLPSNVEELDFEQLPSSGPGQGSSWQLTARISVLTSAHVSS